MTDPQTLSDKICVCAEYENRIEDAEKLAARLGLICVREAEPDGFDLFLKYSKDGLILTDGNLVIRGDFTRMLPRLRHHNLSHELIVKAAKRKGKKESESVAVDATAGMGEDSILLAAAGFRVELYERDPVIAALLSDALERAAEIPGLAEIAGRMRLHEEDSVQALDHIDYRPDVVILDPMFPERQKSALVKKKFQLIHQIEKPCGDEEELLKAALWAKPFKIVIKRPLKGPYLAGITPSYSLSGKAIRYDCLVLS